jgi:hypothetical protein
MDARKKVLQQRHPLQHDGAVVLNEAEHVYCRDLERAPRSVTALVESCFEAFDPVDTITRCFESWKHNASSKYFDLIHESLADGGDDEVAKRAIQALWDRNGQQARDEGTKAHEALELIGNGGDAADMPEVGAFLSWWEGRGLEFFRTELVTFAEDPDGQLALAGSVDLIATDEQGRHVLIDFKRSKKNLSIDEPAYRGKCGTGLLKDVPDTSFWKYSLQLSLYGVMLKRTQGIDVGDRMVILNVHPSCETAQETQAADLRAIATKLLDGECSAAFSADAKRQKRD